MRYTLVCLLRLSVLLLGLGSFGYSAEPAREVGASKQPRAAARRRCLQSRTR